MIGLTGGIGSGKSTVSRFLAELGATVLDADKIGHEVLQQDADVRRQVTAAFGGQILGPDGQVDRARLGKVVFGSAGALARLNGIMHPRIHDMVQARLAEYRRRGVEVVVVEAPLLVEAGWTSLVDEVWATAAPEATVLRRLEGRAELSGPEARARVRSQLSGKERAKHADVVIDTDCSLDELRAKVKDLWQKVRAAGAEG